MLGEQDPSRKITEKSDMAQTQDNPLEGVAISDEDLDKWEALANNTPRGPWKEQAIGSEGYSVFPPIDIVPKRIAIARVTGGRTLEEDRTISQFIAEAREVIPTLISEVRKLRKQIEQDHILENPSQNSK